MKEKYIAWLGGASEGFQPSDEFETLQEAINYVIEHSYGSGYKITKLVEWKIEELNHE